MKFKYSTLIGICFLSTQQIFSQEACLVESFVIEPSKTTVKEKKYSEVQEDLICALEEYLQSSTRALHKIADSQKKALDELRKVVENMPKMSRARIEKELKNVEKLCDRLESIELF